MTTVALNGCNPVSGGMFAQPVAADVELLLASPEGVALVARIDAATDERYPRRALHIRQVALTVIAATWGSPVLTTDLTLAARAASTKEERNVRSDGVA